MYLYIYGSISHSVMADSCNTMDCTCQAPLSMGFFRQEYYSGLPLTSPGDLPNPDIKSRSPVPQADSLLSDLKLTQHYQSTILQFRLPWWLRQLRICLQCGRPGFNPWVGKIPWRRAWQPTPVFLPGECPWIEEPGRLQSMGLQRIRHA